MPDALTVSMIFLALFVWIEGGRAHWRLIVQSDAAVNPQEHAYCEMQAGLARGFWVSQAFRWASSCSGRHGSLSAGATR